MAIFKKISGGWVNMDHVELVTTEDLQLAGNIRFRPIAIVRTKNPSFQTVYLTDDLFEEDWEAEKYLDEWIEDGSTYLFTSRKEITG